ncbi:MAG: hypothetical protein WDA12_03170, partial [Bacilli bacterium]
DTTPPKIDIAVTPETKVGTTAIVTIDYNDSITKQYKVGTSNATWLTYNGSFQIDSYNILSKGWQNEDKTVTIYAKGKDTAGNEITVTKKILNIDLDIPKTPVVTSNYGYPTLTSYGVTFDGSTKIEFDTRLDIDNYYSTDNGVTWLTYKGEFQSLEGTVKAKSVKRDTGLTAEVTKSISMPADALKSQSYDGNDATLITGVTNQYMRVDSSMKGKNIRVLWYASTGSTVYATYLDFLNDNKELISTVTNSRGGLKEEIYTIPHGTKWLKYRGSTIDPHVQPSRLYEIQPSNEPTFTITNGYMLLHADSTKVKREPYQLISVHYFSTSVERLYRIGTSGAWLTYNDQPILVNQDEIIYAKGIDKEGHESRITSTHKVNVIDALKKPAFDNDDTTLITGVTNQYMHVDSSMEGKNIRVLWYASTGSTVYAAYLDFLNDNKELISTVTNSRGGLKEEIYTIPLGTKWLKYRGSTIDPHVQPSRLYEIQPSNEPTFTITNGYMLLHANSTKVKREPYQLISISYFPTSVQRIYRIGTSGEWFNYNDQPILVNQGETIYAKGIDKEGHESRITSTHKVNVIDALKKPAFDNDDTTLITGVTNQYMHVDSSMEGKNIRVLWYASTGSTVYAAYLDFLNDNKELISTVTNSRGGLKEEIYTIPLGTKWLKYRGSTIDPHVQPSRLYEIQPSNEPTFTITNGYMLLHANSTKVKREPYQLISISYFPTSVQRIYRIGTSGEWFNYNDQPILVNQGETIYAKGIDKYGNETRIISNYSVTVPDALKSIAYDGNDATYITGVTNQYMRVDSSMEGKRIRVLWYASTGSTVYATYLDFLNANKELISTVTNSRGGLKEEIYTIPLGTKWLKYRGSIIDPHVQPSRLYEIQPISD